MALFPLGFVLSPRRRLSEPEAACFRLRRTHMYASAKTLVRPCPEKKSLISDLETSLMPTSISEWARNHAP
jgi:hypothetical protein